MTTPEKELPRFDFKNNNTEQRSSDEGTIDGQTDPHLRKETSVDSQALRDRLTVETEKHHGSRFLDVVASPAQMREESNRLNDEVALLRAEKIVSQANEEGGARSSISLNRSRSRNVEPVDDFDAATNPIHERTAIYKPPENPTTKLARFFKYIHNSSWLVRYFTYIVPVVVILLIPVLMGRLLPAAKHASVGEVKLLWFGIWLEIVWLTLWAGRIAAKLIPYPLGLLSSLFTNNAKKWRDLGRQLEIPATLFFWWLGVEISFLPTMKNHTIDGNPATRPWMTTTNKVIVAIFVGCCLNFAEKIIIQLIAISFHLRTYADRIEINKFQIGSLTKLYIHSKAKIAMEDAEFEEKTVNPPSGVRTPGIYADKAQDALNKAFAKVGDVAGAVAGDFVGKEVAKSGHPSQVVLTLLNNTSGSQVLARRLYRTYVREGFETVFSDDLKPAFEIEEEADAAFTMFDKDLNGDISMEELEAVCVEIGRERKSITASLKDLDSVVGKLDNVLFFLVTVITILVLISLISTSAAGVLTSAGSAVLALSWLFSATAQEFLQSCIFVFVKHPFDVGDRVSIYGNTGATLQGDDYFVKEISLLYTEFKKMEGQVVQAPNSHLNTLFILNMRRSGGLAEAVPVVIRFGTTLEQIQGLREKLLEFVTSEKREYQSNILTELREIQEVYSLKLNVVFFYKSNWQNELLRLQRRNKFICAMMVAMQELGIEGPRRNQAGWRNDIPTYISSIPPPTYTAGPNQVNPSFPSAGHADAPSAPTSQSSATIVPGTLSHPSILRTRPSQSRRRGESISEMAKRVDFSLGMKGEAAGEELSDVYEDRSPDRFRNIIQEANLAEDERKAAARRQAEIERRESSSAARTTSRASHESGRDTQMTGGLFRRATSGSVRPRGDSVSSSVTHRNRFLPRRGHTNFEVPRDSLAEEGQAGPIDPRSGQISTQAVRDDSVGSVRPEPLSLRPVSSQTQDFATQGLTRTESHRLQWTPIDGSHAHAHVHDLG